MYLCWWASSMSSSGAAHSSALAAMCLQERSEQNIQTKRLRATVCRSPATTSGSSTAATRQDLFALVVQLLLSLCQSEQVSRHATLSQHISTPTGCTETLPGWVSIPLPAATRGCALQRRHPAFYQLGSSPGQPQNSLFLSHSLFLSLSNHWEC